MNRERTMTDTERLPDGRLRITLDEAGEVALLTMAAIFPPKPRDYLLPDQLDDFIDQAQNAGEDFPEVWLPTGDGAGRWWSVCAVSTRKTSPHAFLHVLTDEGGGLAKQVAKTDLLTVRRAPATSEGVAA